ncbi:HNH endonuclease [Niabella beijingensis]|uniref:HNH endonuclease n=1 Tax=Niabella beijingensis TaxID=2872700 RepID=UPI001CC0CACB|nr:HNH endonuclease [Niabella beijingensis]MBZ4187637.1 HNH endonuclease [Niabella beijingensis]
MPDVISECYEISKQVFEKKIRRTEGISFLADRYGTNKNSTAGYIHDFRCLMEGRRFTRRMNSLAMEYFLENILKDYGTKVLEKALFAFDEHIKYYEGLRKVNLRAMKLIYKRYSALIDSRSVDEIEQEEIIEQIEQSGISKSEILDALKNLKEKEPEVIYISGKAYRRDNKTIAQIKILRDFSCQLCGKYILKRGGKKYIEAAHIKAKHKKGGETLSNIILLCPNHHKEFDLGHLVILNHTKGILEINLNGSNYKIVFEI